jgi:hypothetical protein
MTQEVPELPPITDEDRQFLSYNPNTQDLVDWIQNYAREATTQAVADAQRWQFFDKHAQSTYKGRRFGEWLMFDAVMEHGSRNAAVDEAMRQGAQHE